MKNILFIFSSFFMASGLTAQENNPAHNKSDKEKKIETIKIVDGDTVLHDIRIVKGDLAERNPGSRHKRVIYETEVEISDETEKKLQERDVYINIDDEHKKMMMKKMKMSEDELDEMLESFEEDDDILIDMSDRKDGIRVIKIEINDDGGKEVKVVEDRKVIKRSANNESGEINENDQLLKVYPNPASGELNLVFEVMKDIPVQISIVDTGGKKIFDKTYDQEGIHGEKVTLDKNEKGLYIVTLEDRNRSVVRKIIID